MKTVIAGTRTIQDYDLVEAAVQRSGYEITGIISGGARGVDSLAIRYALRHHLPYEVFIARWGQLGKSAGPIRNREMAVAAEAVIAIWDGKSTGTRNMIELTMAYGKPCFVLLVNGARAESFDHLKGVVFATYFQEVCDATDTNR